MPTHAQLQAYLNRSLTGVSQAVDQFANEELRDVFGILIETGAGALAKAQQSQQDPLRRVTVDLGTARADFPLNIGGVLLSCERVEGDLDIKINSPGNRTLPLVLYKDIRYPITELFLSNAAQTGREVTFIVTIQEDVLLVPTSEIKVASDYDVVNFALDSGRTDVDISSTLGVSADKPGIGFTCVIQTGVSSVRLISATSGVIPLELGTELAAFRFSKIYMTNTAQATLDTDLMVIFG